jgi:hypothetical protein
MTTTTKADTEVMAPTPPTKVDTAVDKVDHAVDKAADRLQEFANKSAAGGGLAAKIAPELAEDAAFVRKLKPSLIMARAKGRAPKNQKPVEGVVAPVPEAGSQPKPRGKKEGPSPFVFVGAAFAAGVLIAKIIDWRGHAHPRD